MRGLFIALSESRRLREIAEHSRIGQRISSRFVAGTQVEDALRATAAVNLAGASVSVDNLGENVTNAEEARSSAALYHQLLDAIAARRLNANISLKLTHMGLDVDEALARELVTGLVAKAASMAPRNFVRVDMEGSAYTQRTLDFVHELHAIPGNQDSFQEKSEVDVNYVKLMKTLMKSGVYHGLATHDENIIDQAKTFAAEESIARDAFEFQMLYGIRRDLQHSLVRQGWRMRVYIPFGTEWYPYLMRRLAERPANVLFIARNLFRQ